MNVSGLTKVGLLLGFGAALSIVSFMTVVRRETGVLVLFLGLLSLGLISASSLCLLFALARYVQARHSRSGPNSTEVWI